jgi:long-subunit fatty acid transport protein
MKRILIFIVLVLTVSETAMSQDDHYWTQQFGAVSTSMGGAVVAGVRDNSAIYYNPGAQAFIDNPNLSVDANLYRLDRILIRNGAGENVNLNSSQMSIYPQIVSGLINIFNVPRLRLGYAILTRNFNNVLMNTRFTNRDLANNPDPDREFIGAFDYANQLNEQWFGASASYQVNEKHGFGLSLFGSYRGQTYSVSNYIREINYVDSAARFSALTIDENIKYGTFVMIFKLGWAFELKRWRVGITMTSPGIWFYGSGSIQREVSLYSSTDQPGDTAFSFLILDRESSIKTVYKHPFSVAAGVEYHTAETRLALTLEYFTGINSYSLMETEADPLVYPPWIKDSADAKEYLKSYLNVTNQAKPVLNVAVGISQDLSKSFTLMVGARTDFSSFKKAEGTDILLHSAGEWDLYNVSTGLSYHTKKQTITLGFNYTFSPRLAIDPYAIINPFSSTGLHSTVFSQTFGVVLGYTHYIKN